LKNKKKKTCEDERSAALYKAEIDTRSARSTPGPSWQFWRGLPRGRPVSTERVWLPSEPSEPGTILLTRLNPKLPTDGWKVVKVERTERVTMNVVILLSQACLEPLAAQQN